MRICRALRLPVFYATAGWAVLVLTVRFVILGCQAAIGSSSSSPGSRCRAAEVNSAAIAQDEFAGGLGGWCGW